MNAPYRMNKIVKPYQGHDFWTKERHDFVRRLHNPHPFEGPFTEYNEGAREVFWGALVAAIAFAFLWQWLPIIVEGLTP